MSVDYLHEKGAASPTSQYSEELDLSTLHEARAGRLVVDPEEARIEFGAKTAARLKLNHDGTKVLWPQPTDSPEDPQNWSRFKKNYLLLIVTLAAIRPDFDSGIGIADEHALAAQFHTTPGVIVDLTNNWSTFLLGWGGIFAVILMRRYGRLPILFWSQLLAQGFLIGCTFAQDLKTFAAMRCLTAFFATCPQVTVRNGLYVVTDLFPFHLQARKLNLWTFGFILSPFLSPFLFGFMVARTSWRWTYGVGSIYGIIVTILIALFMEETMYDRGVKPIPPRPYSGQAYRIHTLIGTTGIKMAKYRPSLWDATLSPFRVVWRPHLLMALIYEGVLFGFTIGINITFVIFLGEPRAIGGYGFGQFAIAACYATPIVSVIIGMILGRYGNDKIADFCIRRNHGVFEAEMRLWMSYIGLPLYVIGFVVIGAALQNHLTIGALIMGWGIAECACMLTTVSIYAYASDCFPRHQGEISALINLFRTLGGFAVAFFQVPWATKNGAVQTFGCEAAIVAGLFILLIPLLQWKGRSLRGKYSMH